MRYLPISLFAFAVVAIVTVVSCGGDSSSPSAPQDPSTVTFATVLNVDIGTMTKTASGLYYKDSIVGTGTQAKTGDSLTVAYTGWLANGTRFDGGTYSFRIGLGRVIQGWEEGLIGVRVGGARKLVIPSNLGYGSGGSPPQIPGNAVLVFNVQLVGLR